MSIRRTYIKSKKLCLSSWGLSELNTLMNKHLAIFDFESLCVQEESLKDTDTTKWNAKHVSISVSISSNLVKEPIFLCKSDPHRLVTSFIGAFENLALQIKALMKNLLSDIKTTVNIKLGSILKNLTQRHNRREQADFRFG